MLTKNILLKSFLRIKAENKLEKKLNSILQKKSQLLNSLSKNYVDSYNFKKIRNISNKTSIRLIGMGGSILGSQAIFNFFGVLISDYNNSRN